MAWLLLGSACAALVGVGLFVLLKQNNSPDFVPDWPETIRGLSYSPFRKGQNPLKSRFPTLDEIRDDLKILSRLTNHIRIYSVEGTLQFIPAIALEFGLEVTLGAWLCTDDSRNEREIALCIELANSVPSVARILIGNEALFRTEVSEQQLLGYLRRVRQAVKVPVSTSEQWHIWEDFPELAGEVDFIAAHILPFWENVPFFESPNYVVERATRLTTLFPGKSLLISEVGWPSKGGSLRQDKSSRAHQSAYLRTQLHELQQAGFNYVVVEAFDQSWKKDEGSEGPHWGIFTVKRKAKITSSGPVVPAPHIRVRLSRLVALLKKQKLGIPYVFAGIGLCYLALLIGAYTATNEYPLIAALPLAWIWATMTLIILIVESHEFLESVWTGPTSRSFAPIKSQPAHRPMVSVHMPCHNEPPDMVKATLNSLSDLNYEQFEVLVIDNNTKDPALWRPIEAHCKKLGPRFKFFHVDPLPGFKAGALNYLISKTAVDAEVVAVIDSDYCVDRNWLKHTVPHFESPNIAVVQAPQNYRDHKDNLFKRCCFSEYRGFFNIGMVIRNNHNAIIQHGTMTLIRKSVMSTLQWAPWCICEDAELGLRALQHGYTMAYVRNSYGKGLIPDTFTDFKKQRFRWAYGAIQIIKQHRTSLITGREGKLSLAQRYYFLAGWLPWAAQGVNSLLTFATLVWSACMITPALKLAPLPWLYSAAPVLIMALTTLKTLCLYDRLVTRDIAEASAAILAGIALYHTIAKAVLYGFFTSSIPFFRTPKNADSHGLLMAISGAREELFIMLLLWGAALGIYRVQGLPSYDVCFWVMMLLIQSLPYLAALIMAFLSSLPKPKVQKEPAMA